MSEPLLTKRLHISGLTPSITTGDLERRLSSFGKVKAMDGFGARDALGDPRKFAFVTMEIGARELTKCLNILSGSTWKGAKLRIGEAKPSFRERLAQFNSQSPRPVRPKRCSHTHGRPSSALPLVPLSATAAATTPGWIVTPSGRVVRPMRMRPGRPLEPMRSEIDVSNGKGTHSRAKKRVKPPPVRARRRLIDPTKWDSVYLKGMFLDAIPVPSSTPRDALGSFGGQNDNILDGEDEEGYSTNSDTSCGVSVLPSAPVRQPQSPQRLQEALLSTSSRIHGATESLDIRSEANTALAILGEMFGDKEDWDGRESIDEMEGSNDNGVREVMEGVEDDGIEIAPRDFVEGDRRRTTDKGEDKSTGAIVRSSHEDGVASPDGDVEMGPPVVQAAKPAPPMDLKALFAPGEEVSFSLLDHFDLDLDLDLDLEADILGISDPTSSAQENVHPSQPFLSDIARIPVTTPIAKTHSWMILDPSLPLLFPPLDSLPHPYNYTSDATATTRRNTPACFLFPSATRVRSHQLPRSATFTRSPQDTPELIRERWENEKSALTHDWKKAWREARGSKRGGRGAGGDGGGY